jgi:glucan phosphorylase
MNVLSIIQRYKDLKAMTPAERKKAVPRVCMFGGKAASGAVALSVWRRARRAARCPRVWPACARHAASA